jgi:hypothetical protein
MNDLSHDSTEELLQWLANAKTTAAQALGHTKSAMNDRLVALYEKELTRRKVSIPSNEDLYSRGIFNGVGST